MQARLKDKTTFIIGSLNEEAGSCNLGRLAITAIALPVARTLLSANHASPSVAGRLLNLLRTTW